MSEPIITVSGLRGVVGESLTAEVAERYAAAFVSTLPPGAVVVTRDGRDSGPMLAEAIERAILSSGHDYLDGGVAATPTTGILIREQQAAGGIQISASHNPAQYNGMKLFSREGRVLPAAAGQVVLDRYRDEAFLPSSTSASQPNANQTTTLQNTTATTFDDTISRHVELVLHTVDFDRIRGRRFRVLLDANRGAGSLVGERLLAELGCEVTLLGGEPDGQFEHSPEPTAENLAGVLPIVREHTVDVAFCQDPDADRLAIVDEHGTYLGEEATLALCVDHVLRHAPGPIVTNCSTSRMSQDLATRYGVPFHRSAVGEANVVDMMLQHDAVIGGEGNGGVIDPRVGCVRDSFVGMALVLDALAARQLPTSDLAAELPRYAICKTKINLSGEKVPVALDALEKHFAEATADRLDGLRLDWPDHWLLVRASNTEPIVRAIAEAATFEEARILCEKATDVLGAAS